MSSLAHESIRRRKNVQKRKESVRFRTSRAGQVPENARLRRQAKALCIISRVAKFVAHLITETMRRLRVADTYLPGVHSLLQIHMMLGSLSISCGLAMETCAVLHGVVTPLHSTGTNLCVMHAEPVHDDLRHDVVNFQDLYIVCQSPRVPYTWEVGPQKTLLLPLIDSIFFHHLHSKLFHFIHLFPLGCLCLPLSSVKSRYLLEKSEDNLKRITKRVPESILATTKIP